MHHQFVDKLLSRGGDWCEHEDPNPFQVQGKFVYQVFRAGHAQQASIVSNSNDGWWCIRVQGLGDPKLCYA